MKRALSIISLLTLIVIITINSVVFVVMGDDAIGITPVPDEKQPSDSELVALIESRGGDKRYVEMVESGQTPYSQTYHDKLTGEYYALITQTPMVTSTGEKINASWEFIGEGEYKAGSNTFEAIVTQGAIHIAAGGRMLDYAPTVTAGGNELLPINKNARLLPVDPVNENYTYNTLEWDYGICLRRLRLIEGQIQGYWVFATNPKSDVVFQYNQVGDIALRLGQFAINEDAESVPTKAFENPADYFIIPTYPLTVRDSLTFYPDASPETTSVDGFAYETTVANWATIRTGAGDGADDSGTDSTFGFRCYTTSGNYDRLYRFITLFDTSAIPDAATITSAVYSVFAYGVVDENSYNLYANVYTSAPASDTAVVAGDYDSLGTTALCDTPIGDASWDIDDYQNFTLNAAGLATISKTGITKLGMREATYDVGGSTPAWGSGKGGRFLTYQAEKGVGYKPKLVVVYTIVVVPTVVTNNAYDVEESSATLSGNLTSKGGGTISGHGFEWDTNTGAPYTNNHTIPSDPGIGEFHENRGGLTIGELYYYRAYAINEVGIGYGVERTFLTKPNEPSGLSATAGFQEVVLSWTVGTGADNTTIYGKVGSYPISRADPAATLVYGNTGTTVTHTGLTNGDHWYYRAWSYCTEGGLEQYSDAYVQADATPNLLAPTNFTLVEAVVGTDTTPSTVNVTWIKGVGANTTLVRYDMGSYPASIVDGILLYSGNGTSCNVSGLELRINMYYFRAWSQNAGATSVGYAQATIGGVEMMLLAFILLPLGLMVIAYWTRRPAIAIGGAIAWVSFAYWNYTLYTALWDIYFILFWLGIGMTITTLLEGFVLRPKPDQMEPEEADEDTFEDYAARRARFDQTLRNRRRLARGQTNIITLEKSEYKEVKR